VAVTALERCDVCVDFQSLTAPPDSVSTASWKLRYEAELRCVNIDLASIASAGETIRRTRLSRPAAPAT